MIPSQLFQFGHTLGEVRDAASSFGMHKIFKQSFQEFLTSLVYTTQVSKKIGRDEHTCAYSTVLIALKKLDAGSQYRICSIFSELKVQEDPAEVMTRISS